MEDLTRGQGIPFSALPPSADDRRQPQSCFGKNQLLRNSISFSLLTTSHPRLLHGSRVRSSRSVSTSFNLLMVSSSRFGSCTYCHSRAINTRFRYASAPEGLRRQPIQTRWLVLQKARRHPCGLRLFVSKWFQVLFHQGLPLLFTFPSRYLFTIGNVDYLALADSSARFLPGYHS